MSTQVEKHRVAVAKLKVEIGKSQLYYGNLVAALKLGLLGKGEVLLKNIEDYKKKHKKELSDDKPNLRQ